ncbi:aldo/keto reductase [Niastella yeongjuensis]|uniref:Aldo/keto reductase n=1 Tax=Niastella yeongjuensis TaxID=354355 RepID=A0A1V9F2U1_9BACT|nr:aldo/keto reductase [Niastella yeongjuensis]OQP52669.1 aldo/keto reductase [Niastella yeongjuensis]SEP33856.1 Predicted oxidoreductase [Niastella yeongjuensis]
MEKIYLSDSGPKVSPAIYGFYRWNEVTGDAAQTMEKIVNLCLELGINTFDHADIYGGYQCEELFGKLINRKSFKREDIVLFSKCGFVTPHAEAPGVRINHYNTSAAHILKSVDNSLRKLRTDYIDIFLLNHLDPLSNVEETALALQRLKDSGKVKNIGVMNFTVFQHQLLASLLKTPIVTNHFELNLLNTAALDNGQLDYCKQRYMRPLASAPLAAGRIANGTDAQAVKVRSVLEAIGKKYNADIESLAVAWLVKLGALPLIGTINEQRIRNIANAFSIDLDHQDWYELYAASRGEL